MRVAQVSTSQQTALSSVLPPVTRTDVIAINRPHNKNYHERIDLAQAHRRFRATFQVAAHEAIVIGLEFQRRRPSFVHTRHCILLWKDRMP